MRRIPGTHVPNIKNRSSKQLIWFTKIKPVERSMSNEQLKDLSNKGYKPADKVQNDVQIKVDMAPAVKELGE